MSEVIYDPTPEQFGVFWKYVDDPDVTDIDFNGRALWITNLHTGRHKVDEKITDDFLIAFAHNIGNCVNKPFNNANKILEADTKELRISIIHDSAATTGISVCIRKSPPVIRNTISGMIKDKYCPTDILMLLINCVTAGMNFVIGGEPGSGKTEFVKFLMQFIPLEKRVITIEDSLEIHYSEINPDADAVELRVGEDFSYTDTIKACLRQNPMWLVLSEARSVEVTSLIEQWSTGVNGITTIHLDDLRKLPDRIENMMNDVNDASRLENRIYRYVNVGVLIRREKEADGGIRRYIDQMCFYVREEHKNRVYMLVEDGEIISRKIPADIAKRLKLAGIDEFFWCDLDPFIKRGM